MPSLIDLDGALATVAGSQHGVVTASDLRRLGFSRNAVRTRVARGALHPVHPRVYAVGHAALSREGRWAAAALAAGPRGALSHLCAAALHGIWRRHVRGVDVVVTAGAKPLSAGGARVHRKQLAAGDVTVVRGIRVTTIARTLVDLCDTLTPQQLAAALDEAAFLGKLDLLAVHEHVRGTRRRRRIDRLETALWIHASGGAGSRSWLEDRMIQLLDRAGVVAPLVNHRVDVGGRALEVDLVWPDHRLCVEIDGPGHRRPSVRRRDAERDRLLQAVGYRVIRLSYVEVEGRPQAVVAEIRAALATTM